MPYPIKEGEWQPIETAPRDGTDILIYPHFFVTSYEEEVGGFARWSERFEDLVRISWMPTHWMPLPKAPK